MEIKIGENTVRQMYLGDTCIYDSGYFDNIFNIADSSVIERLSSYTDSSGNMLYQDAANYYGDLINNYFKNNSYVQTFNEFQYFLQYDLIRSQMFYNCTGLRSIVLPPDTYEIDTSAFAGCSSLESIIIPDRVCRIRPYTFYECQSLTSVVLPADRFFEIGLRAFYDCSSLTTINIPATVRFIDTEAFRNCSHLTDVSLPLDVSIEIGEYSFANSGITSLTIPSKIIAIGANAFSGCTSLTYVNILPGISVLPFGIFQGCSHLQAANIPSTVTTIEGAVFYMCDLRELTIPSSVQSIGGGAFLANSNLHITFNSQTPPTIEGAQSLFGDPAYLSNFQIIVPAGCSTAYNTAFSGTWDYSNFIVETTSE